MQLRWTEEAGNDLERIADYLLEHAPVKSRVDVLKKHLGELPLDALEEPDEINSFKTDSDYAEDVEIATIHRTLETLRAAMN